MEPVGLAYESSIGIFRKIGRAVKHLWKWRARRKRALAELRWFWFLDVLTRSERE